MGKTKEIRKLVHTQPKVEEYELSKPLIFKVKYKIKWKKQLKN